MGMDPNKLLKTMRKLTTSENVLKSPGQEIQVRGFGPLTYTRGGTKVPVG